MSAKKIIDNLHKLYLIGTVPYVILDKSTGEVIEQGYKWIDDESKQAYQKGIQILEQLLKDEQRKAAIEELKAICQEIGCSGLHPDMCQNRPHHCDIIRRLVCPGGVELIEEKWRAKTVN